LDLKRTINKVLKEVLEKWMKKKKSKY
jgi:hypothetical protein